MNMDWNRIAIFVSFLGLVVAAEGALALEGGLVVSAGDW
jgi:hypothetical protein